MQLCYYWQVSIIHQCHLRGSLVNVRPEAEFTLIALMTKDCEQGDMKYPISCMFCAVDVVSVPSSLCLLLLC